MIDSKSGYEFTDEAALDRIKVDGDILPRRNQHGTLRSEDITFLNECRNERLAAEQSDIQSDPAIPTLHVPLIGNDAINKNLPVGWHSDGVTQDSGWLLVDDVSYDNEGSDLSAQIYALISDYTQTEESARTARNSAVADANQSYSTAVNSENERYIASVNLINATYAESKNVENTRHQKAVKDENDGYESDVERIENEIKDIKDDASLTPSEKRRRIAEKQVELDERTLAHEKAVYDESYLHEGNLQEIETAKNDSLATAQSEKDGAYARAADVRDDAIRTADADYETATQSVRQSLASAVRPVIMQPEGYTGSTVSAAKHGAGIVGVSLPGAEAWNRRIDSTSIDSAHSASYAIARAWDTKLHHGLLVWAVYSDYEHMTVIRGSGRLYPLYHTMKVQGESVGSTHDYIQSGGEIAYHSSVLLYISDSTKMRVLIPCANAIIAGRAGNRAFVEVEYNVSGYVAGSSADTSKSYRRVVSATIGKASPDYHADIDSIERAYEDAVEENEVRRDEAYSARKAAYDSAVAAENASYESDIKELDKALADATRNARESASAQIQSIATQATTDAMRPGAENPKKIINEALVEISRIRTSMNGEIAEAKTQHDHVVQARENEHSSTLYGLERDFNSDVSDIDADLAEANSGAYAQMNSAMQNKYQEYTNSRTAAINAHYTAVNKAYQDADDRIDGLDPSDPDYEDKVDAIMKEMASEINDICESSVQAINACEDPVEGRLYAEIDVSDIFDMGVDINSMTGGGMLEVNILGVLFKPNLKTLTGGDFARFGEYYGDATGPTGAQS